jgi:hypothetical protein
VHLLNTFVSIEILDSHSRENVYCGVPRCDTVQSYGWLPVFHTYHLQDCTASQQLSIPFWDTGSACLEQVLTEWQNSCNNELQLQISTTSFIILCMKGFMCSRHGCVINGTSCVWVFRLFRLFRVQSSWYQINYLYFQFAQFIIFFSFQFKSLARQKFIQTVSLSQTYSFLNFVTKLFSHKFKYFLWFSVPIVSSLHKKKQWYQRSHQLS